MHSYSVRLKELFGNLVQIANKGALVRRYSSKNAGGDLRLDDDDLKTVEKQYPDKNLEKGYDSPEDEESDSDNAATDSQDPDAFADGSAATEESDFWSITDDCIMLHHEKARTTLYVPEASSFLISFKSEVGGGSPTRN